MLFPVLLGLFLINWDFEGLKKSNASALIEAEAGQGTDSCITHHRI